MVKAGPQLNVSSPVKVREGEGLLLNLEMGHPAMPYPRNFSWTFNGTPQSNDSRRAYGYPFMSFVAVERLDAGVYSLTTTNFFLDNPTLEAVGSDRTEFTLDVLCMLPAKHTFCVIAVIINLLQMVQKCLMVQ